jgi:hypothetical protein
MFINAKKTLNSILIRCNTYLIQKNHPELEWFFEYVKNNVQN